MLNIWISIIILMSNKHFILLFSMTFPSLEIILLKFPGFVIFWTILIYLIMIDIQAVL